MQDFGSVGTAYQAYSARIRGRLRHELVFNVLASHLKPGSTILDMGCGDGEISLRLGRAGHTVVGVDISAEMLRLAKERLLAEPDDLAKRVSFQIGDIDGFASDCEFDAVCCHGVLMYLDRSDIAVDKLAERVAPGGLLSILSKNTLATGVREAFRGDFADALAQITRGDGVSFGNLGLSTRGDDPWCIQQMMEDHGLVDCRWYGIRVFSDHLPPEMEEGRYQQLLALESEVSSRDPYRSFGRMFHAIGFRSPAG